MPGVAIQNGKCPPLLSTFSNRGGYFTSIEWPGFYPIASGSALLGLTFYARVSNGQWIDSDSQDTEWLPLCAGVRRLQR